MQYDMAALASNQRYKVLASSVTPRPIAWVTTLSRDGARNAAPFSFFNVMGPDPPLLVLGIMRRPDGSYKDTVRNIIDTGEFVVNLVGEWDAAAMNSTCIDAPPDFDEISYADLETVPSSKVAPPLIASAPVSFECKLFQMIEPSLHQSMIIGEVLMAHVADRFLLDPGQLTLDTSAMHLIGRMHGATFYTRTDDLFEMTRPRFGG